MINTIRTSRPLRVILIVAAVNGVVWAGTGVILVSDLLLEYHLCKVSSRRERK